MNSANKHNKLKFLFGLGSMFLITFSIFGGGALIEESDDISPEGESPYYENTMETMNDKSVLSTIKASNKAEKYVENNFTSFVEEINKSDYIDDIVPIVEEEVIDEEKTIDVDICEDETDCYDNNDVELKATSIEYSNSVYIIEEKIYGVYLDFNDDNGYVIISGDYVIYDLQVVGDLEILRDGRDLFYSTIDGFVYFDEDNECQKLFNKKVNDDNLCSSAIIYPGQDKAGDGQIDSDYISEYVAARYPNYTYDSCNVDLSSTFECTYQFDTSYYIKKYCDEYGNLIDNYSWCEGNCVLNSIFNVMRDWSKHSKIGNVDYNTTSNVTSSILRDPLYETYGKGIVVSSENSETKETEYYKWTTNISGRLVKMHNLYINVRAYAIKEYDYTPESGIYFDDVSDIIEYVAQNSYGLKVKTKTKSTISSAISALDAGEATCMSIHGGQTYDRHTVALMGYQKYTYTSSSGSFSSKKTAYFYQIADGWNETPVYFDPNTDYEPSLNFVMLK